MEWLLYPGREASTHVSLVLDGTLVIMRDVTMYCEQAKNDPRDPTGLLRC